MKTRSKALLLTLCAVLLVAASVLGTMAYLTSTDSVENTFTVGNVSITLDEAALNGFGQADDSKPRVKANSYNLLPGHTYSKDPTVTVEAGSEQCYVKMTVTVNKTAELDKIFADKSLNIQNVVTGYDSSKWIYKGNTKNADNTRTYEFWYSSIIDAKGSAFKCDALFTNIKVPDELTNEELATLKYKTTITTNEDGTTTATTTDEVDELVITVNAYAIQADGFADAAAAWAAYNK